MLQSLNFPTRNHQTKQWKILDSLRIGYSFGSRRPDECGSGIRNRDCCWLQELAEAVVRGLTSALLGPGLGES